MKIRVRDSDGVFRGGLFNTRSFNDMSCRVWHGFPHPHFQERLIDINTKGKRSSRNSWYLLRISRHPEMSGPPDGSDDFDSQSQAYKITPNEALEWFKRVGFDAPEDLIRLVLDKGRGKRSSVKSEPKALDPFAPYMPASWFRDKFGIPADRLRSAHRNGKLRAEKWGTQVRYSVPGAMEAWPADEIALPAAAAKGG